MSALQTKDEQASGEGTIAHPPLEELELAAVLHALSDPIRLQIVATVADGREWTCGSLDLPVSKSTCTHHFRVLREAGVIQQRVVGTTRLNSLRRDDLEHRFPGLIDAVIAGVTPALAPGSGQGAQSEAG